MGIRAEDIQRRLFTLLRSRKTPLWIAAIVIGANIQVLGSGLFSDDYFHLASIAFRLSGVPVEGHWWEIYGVPTSRGPSVPSLIQKGMLPWWTSEEYSTAFFRPLAVATHYFDAIVFRAKSEWMHAHNLLWYALLVLLVGYSHRRFMQTPLVASFATFIYCVDEAHSEGLAWIAGRNTLMSACGVVGVLLAHEYSQRTRRVVGRAISALIFAFGLAAGEGGVAAWAYLLAYASILDRGSLSRRMLSLSPYFVITLAWFALYRMGGYGARGGAIYLDPLRDPFEFFSALPTRYSLLWIELTTVPNTIYDIVRVDLARPLRIATFCMCVAVTIVFVRLALVDRIARFWLVGTCLSILPFCGVASGTRLLFVPGIGSTALLGLLVKRLSCVRVPTSTCAARIEGGGRRFLIGSCLVAHLLCAVVFIPSKLRTVDKQNALLRALASSLPVRGEVASRSTVLVLNTAGYLFSLLTPFGRSAEDRVEALYIFGAAQEACTVSRLSHCQLRLDCPSGFVGDASATFVRDPRSPFKLGERHRVGPVALRVVALDLSGRATGIELEVDSVDDPRWVWTYWDGSARGYRRVQPPPLGKSSVLPVTPSARRAETHLWL